jgi:hypothetical protein
MNPNHSFYRTSFKKPRRPMISNVVSNGMSRMFHISALVFLLALIYGHAACNIANGKAYGDCGGVTVNLCSQLCRPHGLTVDSFLLLGSSRINLLHTIRATVDIFHEIR